MREIDVAPADHPSLTLAVVDECFDALASAATLVMGETTEKIPLALIRGLPAEDSDQTAADINRPLEEDLFR